MIHRASVEKNVARRHVRDGSVRRSGGKAGAIIFIDELDAIGTKRFGGEQSGDRETPA